MSFADLMIDVVAVYDASGRLIKNEVPSNIIRGEMVLTSNADFPIEIGYLIERKLPSGIVERYRVIEPNYIGAFDEISAHYQMKVINVNAVPDPRTISTINTINASGNARVYQHSVDNSQNTYTSLEYKEALNKIKSDVLDLALDPVDQALTTKALTKITEEIEGGNPNKDKLGAYVGLLPTAVTTLESVLNLTNMFGLS